MSRSAGREGGVEAFLAAARELASRGLMDEAARVLSRGLRRRGPRADLYSERAWVLGRRRRYEGALQDMTRAIRLSPADPGLYAQRLDLLLQMDRPAVARRDLARAIRLGSDDPRLRLARLRLWLEQGRGAQARAFLRALLRGRGGEAGEALFLRGCLSLREGRPAAADRDFARAALFGRREEGGLGQRAAFYRLVARAAGRRPRGVAGPRLRLCGLGLFPPYTATTETIRAIRGCDLVINNVSGPETQDLLVALVRRIVPGTYDNRQDNWLWTRRILGALGAGRVVGFVTRGHPLAYGDLGGRLVRSCRRKGIPCEVYGAVTSLDVLSVAMAKEGRGGRACFKVLDWRLLGSSSRLPGLPQVITLSQEIVSSGGPRRLLSLLRGVYPAGHPCWVFGPAYESPPACVPLGALSRAFPRLNPSHMIFLPPAEDRP